MPFKLSSLQHIGVDRDVFAPAVRRKLWRGWAILGILLVVVAICVAFIPKHTAVQVTMIVVRYPSQQYSELTASGYVVAQRRAALASKATGRLVELRVREGARVKQGELLAQIDPSDVRAALRTARAGIEQAQAAAHQSRAALRQAQVEGAGAETDLARSNGLATQGFISSQSLDTARLRVQSTQAAVVTAQAAVAASEAAIVTARAQFKAQEVNEGYTEIRAPFDGVVLVKNANVGDIITPFSNAAGSQGAVVTIADMSTLEVEVDVSERNLGKVTIGQPVEITLDALPDKRFRGKVGSIVPTVDRSKATVMTKIQFEQLDPRILPEMGAKVNFLSRPITDADQTPVMAVNPAALAEGAKVQVFRVKGDRVEAIDVETGRRLGDVIEVRGPLSAGDRIVLTPRGVADGTAVNVVTK